MKILLVKDIKSLGKVGEIKEVKNGYGQNFLIKKGFAIQVPAYVSKEAWHELLMFWGLTFEIETTKDEEVVLLGELLHWFIEGKDNIHIEWVFEEYPQTHYLSDDEVYEYCRSGGVWGYYNPRYFYERVKEY